MAQNSNRCGYFCHKCKTGKEDIMINCFACDANFHAKCIGLTGSMADKINLDKGFHYYCPLHKELSTKALLFKLSQMQKLNIKLLNIVDEFKDVLNYNADDLLKQLDSTRSTNNIAVSDFVSKIEPPNVATRSQNVKNLKRKPEKTNSGIIEKKQRDEEQTSTPQNLNVSTVTIDLCNTVHIQDPLPSTSGEFSNLHRVDMEKLNSITKSPSVNLVERGSPRTVTKHLKLATRAKSLFITGIDKETSVDDIREFLSQFYDSDQLKDIHVNKINSKSMTYVSFRIFCSPNSYDEMVNIWKNEGVSAREFTDARKRYPSGHQSAAPKN